MEVGIATYVTSHPRDWRFLWLKRTERKGLAAIMTEAPDGEWLIISARVRGEDGALNIDYVIAETA